MIAFRMNKIAIEQFAILSTELQDSVPINLEANVRFSASAEVRNIASRMRFTFSQSDSPLLVLELVCYFELEEASWKSLRKGDEIISQRIFGTYGCTYSRDSTGCSFCKTENTPLNSFILPPLNVAEMITEDFVIK